MAGPRLPILGTVALLTLMVPLPAATACTTGNLYGVAFHPLEWVAKDRLLVEWGGRHWAEVNLTTGIETAVAAGDLPTSASPPSFLAQASGGNLSIEPVLRTGPATTSSPPCAPGVVLPQPAVAYRLARQGSDEALHEWGDPASTVSWAGAVWSNATHGFVWDHARQELTAVRWSDASLATAPLALDAVVDAPSPDRAVHRLGDAVVLPGAAAVAVIDPAGPSVRVVRSPLDHAYWQGQRAEVRGSAVDFHGRGDPWAEWAVAHVSLLDGRTAWTVQTRGRGAEAVTERTVFSVEPDAHVLHRFLDGKALEPIPLAGQAPVVLSPNGDGAVAVGLDGPRPRLLVFGASMETLYDGQAAGSQGPEGRGAPGAPVWLLAAALAASALALRRRRP